MDSGVEFCPFRAGRIEEVQLGSDGVGLRNDEIIGACQLQGEPLSSGTSPGRPSGFC